MVTSKMQIRRNITSLYACYVY